MDRNQAAELLATAMFENCCIGSLPIMKRRLSEPKERDSSALKEASAWYMELPEPSRRMIDFIVRQSVEIAVFGAAVLLDGDTGMIEIGEGRGEIGVSMRVYNTVDNAISGIPDEVVTISPADKGYMIHDLLMDLVDDADAKNAWAAIRDA